MPVLVGSLSHDKEQNYGRLFGKYLTDPENFFVISSDFCHWGKNKKLKKKLKNLRERSGSVIECLTRDQGAAGSSLTGVMSLNKTH